MPESTDESLRSPLPLHGRFALRTCLVVLVLVVALPAILLAGWFAWYGIRSDRDVALHRLEEAAEALSRSFEQEVEGAANGLLGLAALLTGDSIDPSLIGLALSRLQVGEDSDVEVIRARHQRPGGLLQDDLPREIALQEDLLRGAPLRTDPLRTDPLRTGLPRAERPRNDRSPILVPVGLPADIVDQALRTRKPAVSNLFEIAPGRGPYLAIVVPAAPGPRVPAGPVDAIDPLDAVDPPDAIDPLDAAGQAMVGRDGSGSPGAGRATAGKGVAGRILNRGASVGAGAGTSGGAGSGTSSGGGGKVDPGQGSDFVALRIAPALLFRSMERPRLEGTLAALVDGNGRILARSRAPEQFVGKRVPDWARLESIGERRGAFLARVAERDADVMFGFRRVDNTPGWAVVVGESADLYLPVWQRPLQSAVIGSLLVLAMAFPLAAWLARRVLRTVKSLAGHAERVVLGPDEEFRPAQVEPSAIREFERLRQALARADESMRARIEAERRSARALAESELRYRTLAETGALVMWRCDPEGRLIDVSGWAALAGREAGQRGATIDGWYEQIEPDDRPEVRMAWNMARQ